MSLALANRSAELYQLKHLKLAVEDIDFALEAGYPKVHLSIFPEINTSESTYFDWRNALKYILKKFPCAATCATPTDIVLISPSMFIWQNGNSDSIGPRPLVTAI